MKPTPTLLAVHSLMMAVALLAGCGGGGDDSSPGPVASTPSTPPAPTPPAPTPPAPTPPAPTPPAPTPPPPSSGPTFYFSDCVAGSTTCAAGDVGNNSDEGTDPSRPKQFPTMAFVNEQPAGTHFLFKRGGTWNLGRLEVQNPRATPSQPLVFGAYGSGAAPVLRSTDAIAAFQFGGRWANTDNDGGYTVRDLTLDGQGTGHRGFWLVQNVRNVTLDNLDITGFRLGLESSFEAPHGVTGLTIRNSRITRNRSMGVLGQFSDSVIENNVFEENNYITGEGLNHGSYLSGHSYTGLDASGNSVTVHAGRNITLRGNRYIRNSVVTGPVTIDRVTTTRTRCTGGNMTFHGRMDNVLIEGNTIEQNPGFTDNGDQPGSGCFLMSITQGYSSTVGVEGFTNFVVRNNRLINGGNTAMAVSSAPGIRIEGNTFINQQGTTQAAISVGKPIGYSDGASLNYYVNYYRDFFRFDEPIANETLALGIYADREDPSSYGDLIDRSPVVRNNLACHQVVPAHTNSRVTQFLGPLLSPDVNSVVLPHPPVEENNTSVQSNTGSCARSTTP